MHPCRVNRKSKYAVFTVTLAKGLAAGGLRGCLRRGLCRSPRLPYATSLSRRSPGYLYFLPLGIGAMFLRSRVSYGLIAVAYFCMTSSGLLIPAQRPGLPHNLTAAVGFTFVVYVIQTYVKRRERLDRLCASSAINCYTTLVSSQVQSYVPAQPSASIAGLEIAGTMPTRQRR